MPPFSKSECLPQDDEDSSGRGKALAKAQDSYAYTYAKPNMRGFTMCEKLPPAELPAAAWLAEAAKVAGALVSNSKQADEALGVTSEEVAQGLGAKVKAGGPAALLEGLATLVINGKLEGPARSLADFSTLFQVWPAPVQARDYFLDTRFATERLAGPNPEWIERVPADTGLPEDLNFSEAHYQAAMRCAAMGEGDSLEAAQAEGRLFVCAYRQLMNVNPGCHPVPAKVSLDYEEDPAAWDAAYAARERAYAEGSLAKMALAPTALFALAPGGKELLPVAIQLAPNGWRGDRHPVFTPRDGVDWLAAKTCVSAADGTAHEMISHLGRGHMVQEAFCLAMHNCLAARHPLHRLLSPHFEGTFLINTAADLALVNSDGFVDALMLPTIGGAISLTREAVTSYDFNAATFPDDLAARGVADAPFCYPYRDDGMLLWGALSTWVERYVHHYYCDEAAVAADLELQAFVVQVGQYDARDARGRRVGGGIGGVGEGGARVQTRAYLTRMLTQIIWNGSGHHAAVNFAQSEHMSHAAAAPIMVLGERPRSGQGDSAYLEMLPHLEGASEQLVLTKALGSIFHTKLGHYPKRAKLFDWFRDETIQGYEAELRAALEQIEGTITQRNAGRPEYIHLLPSRVPQSINI